MKYRKRVSYNKVAALLINFGAAGLQFYYDGIHVGARRVDFIVENDITSLQFKKVYNPKYRKDQDSLVSYTQRQDLSKSCKSPNPANPDPDKKNG